MSTFAFVDATIWAAGYDLTGDSNQLAISASAEEKECTPFGVGGFRKRIGGLRTVESQVAGYWQAGTNLVDAEAFTNLAVADRVVTIAPALTETSTAYMFRGGHFSYELFGQHGEVTPFSLSMLNTNSQGLIRGQVAKAKANVSATGATGSVVQLGTVGASQFVYATLHVFSVGTTITVQVQSDDNPGFTTPTTVGTIGPVTVSGGTWMTRVAGPLTDTYYRFNVSAVTGTFQIAGAIGIGS